MSIDIDNKFSKLIKDLCENLQNFPPESIERGVILLSKGNENNESSHSTLFDHLSERKRLPSQKSKITKYKISDDVLLIDPTRKMLQPEQGSGFVTQHYLLRTMKQAKFIFVFEEAHTARPIKTFTDTLLMFSQFFKTEREMNSLADACGFVILNSTLNFQIIKKRLLTQGLQERDYIGPKNKDIIQLCEKIFAKKNVHLVSNFNQNNNKEKYVNKLPFLQFLSKIQYFDLRYTKDNQLYFSTSLPVSKSYQQYEGGSNKGIFKNLFDQSIKLLVNHLDIYVNKKREQLQRMPSVLRNISNDQLINTYGEPALVKIINSSGWNLQNNQKKNVKINKPQSQKILLFLNDYLEATYDINQESTVRTIKNRLTQKILTSLFENGYLQNREIERFFLSSKHFSRCFPYLFFEKQKQKPVQYNLFDQKQLNLDLVVKIQKQDFHNNIYTLFYRFIDYLMEDIQAKIPLNFGIYQSFFTKVFHNIENMKYKCFSNRMIKKLEGCQAQIAYYKAKINQNPKNWLSFIKISIKNHLIMLEKREEALMIVGGELEKKQQWKLALEIYQQVSIIKSYRSIIAIYQKRYKFAPEIMKYIKQNELVENSQYFINYCHFLMKIGLNEKVRELCLEGLRLSNNPAFQVKCQNTLMNARGDNYKSLHHKFLEETIIDKNPIIYDENLLDMVENIFRL